MTRVLGYSALRSGAGLLPMMATFAAVSFASGPLYERFHAKVVVSCGAAAIAAGIFVLSIADRGSSYLLLVPGMLVLGVGIGLFYAAVTTAAVTALDPSRTSLAGGIVYMFQIAGGSIGLGVNTAIVLAGSSLAAGIQTAFRVDTVLTLCALAVSLIAVGGRLAPGKLSLPYQAHHRAIR
jgi:MFS family permease